METFGDLEGLKKSIETHYRQELDAYKQIAKDEHEHAMKKVKKLHAEKMEVLKKHCSIHEQVTFKTVLAEKELEAKKMYEQKRETLINSVFSEALKRSRSILLGKRYSSMIKQFAKKQRVTSIEGNYKEYAKIFPKFKQNNDASGIIMRKGPVVYDFTYASFIMSHKPELRHTIVEVLFNGS